MTQTAIKQFHISSKPRHLRYIYFVSEHFSYENLFSLMSKNQLLWGGRFNPIIPVINGEVSRQYLAVIQHYDPDYICYTSDLNLEYLKNLADYNPVEYINLDDPTSQNDITGVNGLYFISQYSHFHNIILPHQLYTTNSPLLNYYEINFGINTNVSQMDVELTKNYKQIEVIPDLFDKLHEFIYTNKPINKLHLAEHNINNVILRSNENISYEDVEIVIAKDSGTVNDLLYFWNRKLFAAKRILYVTMNELEILKNDQYFGPVLYNIEKQNFKIISMTLSDEEVLDVIQNIFKPLKLPIRFLAGSVKSFPFKIRDADGNSFIGTKEDTTHQLLLSEKGLYNLPKLSFTDKIGFYPQKWVVDVDIRRIETHSKTLLRFPCTTSTHLIFRSMSGRITKYNNVSLFIYNDGDATFEINIPNPRQIIQQLITNPVIDGKYFVPSIQEIRSNDAGNRLKAFINAFGNNFHEIDEFFTDIFWVELFEYLITNNKQAGDAIKFSQIKERCITKLCEKGIELKSRQESNYNEENLEMGLKSTLEQLCSYQVFFKGFNLKCKTCSSTFWYHINESAEFVTCKGCLHRFTVPVESSFYYKLNDLIKNNMFHNKELRDGNLTVIRTLINLKNKSRIHFCYLPQIDLFINSRKTKPLTDLDIVSIVDGKLYIGEAKHTSTAFFEKNSEGFTCLDTLAKIALEILPHTLVLSCYENPSERLENAGKTLAGKFYNSTYKPNIEIMELSKPSLFNLGSHMYFYY